eukprot:gene5407-biopygen1944
MRHAGVAKAWARTPAWPWFLARDRAEVHTRSPPDPARVRLAAPAGRDGAEQAARERHRRRRAGPRGDVADGEVDVVRGYLLLRVAAQRRGGAGVAAQPPTREEGAQHRLEDLAAPLRRGGVPPVRLPVVGQEEHRRAAEVAAAAQPLEES